MKKGGEVSEEKAKELRSAKYTDDLHNAYTKKTGDKGWGEIVDNKERSPRTGQQTEKKSTADDYERARLKQSRAETDQPLAKTPDYNKMYPALEKGKSKFGDWMKKNPGVALGTVQSIAGITGASKVNREANAIQDIKSSSPTYSSEAEKLKQTADQAVSAIMNGTNKQNADAMGNYMRVAKESGGSNAAAVLSNSAKVTSAGSDSYLKGMQAAAQLKLGAQEGSSRLRTEGAKAAMETDAMNRQFKERRIEQKREIANNNINAGIQNVSGQLMRSDYLDRMDETERKYKNNLTGKYKKGGMVKSKKGC
jgi:hypothetical protein